MFGRTVLAVCLISLAASTAIFVAKASFSKFLAQRKYLFINTFISGGICSICIFSKFQFLTTVFLGISSIAYFAMLSREGYSVIGNCRIFYWARYVDMAITVSLVILELGMLVNMDAALVYALMGCNGTTVLFSSVFQWLTSYSPQFSHPSLHTLQPQQLGLAELLSSGSGSLCPCSCCSPFLTRFGPRSEIGLQVRPK